MFLNSCRMNNTVGFQSLTDRKCCPGEQKVLRFRFVAPSNRDIIFTKK